jgi:hypothetical protein
MGQSWPEAAAKGKRPMTDAWVMEFMEREAVALRQAGDFEAAVGHKLRADLLYKSADAHALSVKLLRQRQADQPGKTSPPG